MILRPPLVLVYHGVGDVPAEHDPDRLFVATRTFIGQIRSLRRRGYGSVTVAQFAERLRGGAPLDGGAPSPSTTAARTTPMSWQR